MEQRVLFNMKRSVVIGAGNQISPRTRELILISCQTKHDIYVYHDLDHKDEINDDLKSLLGEYGFDYKICPSWVNSIISEKISNGDIVVFKDNKYIGVMKYQSNEDCREILNVLMNDKDDNFLVMDENLIDGNLLEESIVEPITNDYIENDHGIREFVKRKYKSRKNR